MRNELNVWVIGGDMRQVSLADLLQGRLPQDLPDAGERRNICRCTGEGKA